MKLHKRYLTLYLPIIIIVPFIIISFFNHPALDDWWYAEVYKQYGFFGAQNYWYTHYTARFFSNFLMSMEPLALGWIEGHKVMPIVFIMFLYFTFSSISKVFFKNHWGYRYALPLWFTASYLLIQRDYFECLYWLAANVVYQYTMLYSMLHATLLYQLIYKDDKSLAKQILAIVLAIAAVGSNETLGGLILVASLLVFYYSIKTRRDQMFSVVLLAAVVLSWVVMFMARGNWDKIKVATGEHIYTFDFLLAVKHSLLSSGYYTLFLLKQPFVWCLAILSIPFLKHLVVDKLLLKRNIHFLLLSVLCFLIAFTIYFISIYPTGILIPPLRVTNIAMIFLYTGLVSAFAFITVRFSLVNHFLSVLNKHKAAVMIACVLLAIVSPSKFQQVLTDLASGKTTGYNKEMYSRYEIIKSYNGPDTLLLPKIKNVPRTVVATDISGPVSENIPMVFNKPFKARIVEQR